MILFLKSKNVCPWEIDRHIVEVYSGSETKVIWGNGVSCSNKTKQHTTPCSTHTCALLKQNKWEIFKHPPYNPDLAPSDYHSFPHLTKFVISKSEEWTRDERHCTGQAERLGNNLSQQRHTKSTPTIWWVPEFTAWLYIPTSSKKDTLIKILWTLFLVLASWKCYIQIILVPYY